MSGLIKSKGSFIKSSSVLEIESLFDNKIVVSGSKATAFDIELFAVKLFFKKSSKLIPC